MGWGIVAAIVACVFVLGLYRVVTDRPVGCRANEVRMFPVLRVVKDRTRAESATPASAEEFEALRQWARALDDRCLRAEDLLCLKDVEHSAVDRS